MKYSPLALSPILVMTVAISGVQAQILEQDDSPTVNRFTYPSSLNLESEVPLPEQSAGYILGGGDRVIVNIFGLPDYSREYSVLLDGTLNLPLIGSVYVQGLTLPQASQAIEQGYRAIIQRPVVTLDLTQPRPLQVAVVGAVNRPGTYSIATVEQVVQGERDQRITVTTAIDQAGGITQTADIRNVEVFRPAPNGNADDEYFTANLWDLVRFGDLSQDPMLRDGDTILVPEATQLDNAEITAIASANFSPDTIDVYVVGEVGDPGLVQVKPNTPLNQALLAAGGFDLVRAARGTVRLVRLNPDGTVSERAIPVDFAAAVNEETNPAMRPNDAIIVGRSTLTSVTDTLNQIFSPVDNLFDFVRVINND